MPPSSKRQKIARDPNQPKQNKTPFNFFSVDAREVAKAKYPNATQKVGPGPCSCRESSACCAVAVVVYGLVEFLIICCCCACGILALQVVRLVAWAVVAHLSLFMWMLFLWHLWW